MSIVDARPLKKAAEALEALHGVPISYEDPSAYAYNGDLSDPFEFRAANALPPRDSSLKFVSEHLKGAIERPDAHGVHPLLQAAPEADVARILQSVVDQHASNGNPGRFKILATPAGLVIVPTAARNSRGERVPDQSLLDFRISLPEMDTDADLAIEAFCKALSAASGKTVQPADAFLTRTARIGADNEVARDVLVRLLNGMHETRGGIRNADGTLPVVKVAWTLTTQPGFDPQHAGTYLLGLRNVAMEGRYPGGRSMQHKWMYQQP